MSPVLRLLGLAAALLCIVALGPAGAAEITVLSAGAIRSVLEALVPRFQKETGHHVVVAYGTAGEVERRLKEQEAVDVAIATKPRIQTLEGAGTIVAGSVGMIGRSPIALAVRQGAAKPDIGSVDAFKRALLAAKSVAYTDPASGGTSGIHIASVLRRLGIAEQLQPRTKLVTGRPGAPPAVGEAVAHGEAELGMQPISELIGTPGIEIVGLIPAELQTPDLTYAAGLATAAKDREAGMALIGFLIGPASADIVKSKGLIPGDGP
jgi:molybdate transport system substrate-binding protein